MRFKKYLIENKWGRKFIGFDYGGWREVDSILGIDWDWYMVPGLSSENNRKNYSVEGATETHEEFLKSLKQIVKEYPDLKNYLIKFDSPDWYRISDILTGKKFDWKKIDFFHGTSSERWEIIKKEGLKPRRTTKVKYSYGSGVGAEKGRDDLIYLTNQKSMANFAAIDAAKVTNSDPVILLIKGKYLDERYFVPDEDSRQQTARTSLDKMGSVGYKKTIQAKAIKRIK